MAKHIKNVERHLKGIEDEDASEGASEGINGDATEDEGIFLPDYYDALSLVPDVPWRTIWANEDGEVEMPDDTLRLGARGIFVQPKSELGRRLDSNIKQIQETRKVCNKISVVKQMQVQTQV